MKRWQATYQWWGPESMCVMIAEWERANRPIWLYAESEHKERIINTWLQG